MTWTRRAFAQALMAGVASPIGFAAFAQNAAEKQLYEAAKAEGQLTWSATILDQAICDKVGQAFAAKYPGVRVNAIKTTAQVAFQRLMQDLKAGVVQIDVLTTTDASHMSFLERKSELTHYVPENAKDLVPVLRDFGVRGYYQVSLVGLVTIVYNSAKITQENAPKDWPDLTDSRWKDRITFGSPNFSGMVGVWTVAMEDRYGWEYFEKLNRLNPLIGRSIDDAATALNSGERIVAAGHLATALRNAAKGNPVAFSYPASGTVGVMSPSGILRRAKNQNAAKLFMEFLASPEYSRILAENAEQPLRFDVPPPTGAKSLSDIKLYTVSIDEIEKKLPIDREKWRETFE